MSPPSTSLSAKMSSMMRFSRSQVSGSPSTSRPAPFDCARRSNSRDASSAASHARCALRIPRSSVSFFERRRLSKRSRSTTSSIPFARRWSACPTGKLSGTVARSTPRWRQARTASSSMTSQPWRPCEKSSSEPSFSSGTISSSGASSRASESCRRRSARRARADPNPAIRHNGDNSPLHRLQSVDDTLQRAQKLMAQWDDELRRELPEGADIFDAHTHLGTDIDGMVGNYEELERGLDKYGISRCFMFCLDEPDRHPGFRAGNDRTLEFGERSIGRMIPFARLDLAEDPIGEATRMLDRGARGIKLHPRAQKFLLNDERLSPIFEVAADRKVPILIHGGRGLPPIADDLARVADRNPDAQLIVAHAGIADLAALADRLGGKAGVFFDTSVWSPLDLLGLYRLVGPEQVVYASDYPYGQQPASLLIALRTDR